MPSLVTCRAPHHPHPVTLTLSPSPPCPHPCPLTFLLTLVPHFHTHPYLTLGGCVLPASRYLYLDLIRMSTVSLMEWGSEEKARVKAGSGGEGEGRGVQ